MADLCEDTCCAGWQIVIDRKSLADYKKTVRNDRFGSRLKKGIDWRRGTFRQDKEGRCAFLNDRNLCNLYSNLGEKSLCRTCRLYPRHIEEFEGVREITLSVSCPEVAKMLLARITPVTFRTYEKLGEEEYEAFDPFLFSILQDTRSTMIAILQNRALSVPVREGLVLGMTHDIQRRLAQGNMFECREVMERYLTPEAAKYTKRVLESDSKKMPARLFSTLFQLELLKEDWNDLCTETAAILYMHGEDRYWENRSKFEVWKQEHLPNWDIHLEQLLVYFVFTYFLGAVYDGEVYSKSRFAISMVHLIQEIWFGRWMKNKGTLSMEEMAELLYRFSREVEHSDENLKLAEKLLHDHL